MKIGKLFFETYVHSPAAIVDIGSQDMNGSLRTVAPKACQYVGVDFASGLGVDVVLKDAYSLPLGDESFDVAVSSSCFEHSEFFWLTFLEILRVLKPGGLLYLNVPSNGHFHRCPVDCWRFYPDSGVALQNWARRHNVAASLLESFIGPQYDSQVNDFVAVFAKSDGSGHPVRMIDSVQGFTNAVRDGASEWIQPEFYPEDQRIIGALSSINPLRIAKRVIGRIKGLI